jgi:hypothetical protein
MLIEERLSIFSECGGCVFVSIACIRLLKKMYTETIKSNTAKMINMSKAFFLI